MNVTEILDRGRAMGIPGLEGLGKGDMIREIQLAEGSRDCFGTPWRFDCQQFDCCWRQDCLIQNPG